MKKRCVKCKTHKTRKAFGQHSTRSDGLQTWCKRCQKKYQAERRKRLSERQHVEIPKKKRCSRCREIRRSSDFSFSHGQVDGLHNQCRFCVMERPRASYTPRAESKIHVRRLTIKKMLADQKGLCAICSIEMGSDCCLDHCHVTGRVRGLLCRLCNCGLGFFRDDPQRLHAAIKYLKLPISNMKKGYDPCVV